jgi:hypothetical protein
MLSPGPFINHRRIVLSFGLAVPVCAEEPPGTEKVSGPNAINLSRNCR